MFFELHDERKIGYKLLSDADLGTGTSHQTHIGLSEGVLSFLSDRDIISEDSIFIYGESFDYIDAYFDRIENPDGTFRSPKIKTGGKDAVSVTSTIRDIVRNDGKDLNWFLFWFGLKNDKIVFLLFNSQSNDYKSIMNLGLNLAKLKARARILQDSEINVIANFIENKLNQNGLETLKELEVVSQVGIIQSTKLRQFNAYDINKANENFKLIGKTGEELINNYLKIRARRKEIQHFTWYNQSRESGMPYDFSIENTNGNIVNLDVKTTKFDFKQKIIFSSQEIDFISQTSEDYNIYRVYRAPDNSPYLRICDNCKNIATRITAYTTDYRNNLSHVHTDLRSAKLAISPENELFKFKASINVGDYIS